MAHLVLDFPDPASPDPHQTAHHHGTRWFFRNPVDVIVARSLAEVRPAIERVEQAVADGMHAAGYLAYEAAPAFEPAMRVRPGSSMPLAWFGIFQEPEHAPTAAAAPTGGRPGAIAENPLEPLDWRLEWTREEFGTAVDAVRDAIAAGRTYQVNLTTRMRAGLGGDPWPRYERMRRAQGAGYHAYLDLGQHVILSASPELFFRTRGRTITTRPMKGTRRRGRWLEEDRAMAAALRSSEKDRAENLMIVDLLRNDLGRICDTGSIRTPSLQRLERYPTVWQMTSTVEGEIRDGVRLTGLLDALFPCGSVTGAPKISTMAEIARLEPSPREVYCGAIGWIRPGGDCTFSVAIRTARVDRETGEIEYGTGGGVVWDSTAEDEYDELRTKAVVVREPWPEFALLETLGLRDGRFARRDRHLARLHESASYFDFPYPAERLDAVLDDLALRHPEGAHLTRLTLHPDGRVTGDRRPLESIDAPTAAPGSARCPLVMLSPDPIDSADPFLFHKTTHRVVYEARRTAALRSGRSGDAPRVAVLDVLLQNERGEVTEFTRGNVVIELDGARVTPARSSGLLNGCLRQELIEAGEIVERVVRTGDLRRATRIWFINSARGWIEVALG